MRDPKHWLLAVTLLVGGCYALWSRWGRRPPAEAVDLRLAETYSFGTESGDGNLLGIEPHMVPGDYASEERFYRKLDGVLAVAERGGLIRDRTVVVFPEHLGTWLVLVGEKEAAYRARTVNAAARLLVASNLLAFLRWLPKADAPEWVRCTLFKMKAQSMADVYQRVFSFLARQYAVTVVAGSILLPDPRIREGKLEVGEGRLYSVSVVYGPDGRAQAPLVRKAFPTEEETRYIAAGTVDELPVFETPLGRLGVLVCADAWYPRAYRVLKRRGVDLVAVPSCLSPRRPWDELWPGYSGGASPDDVDPDDEGRLREGEACEKYGLAARLTASGARAGMSVFLRGKLWELEADGQACVAWGHIRRICGRTNGTAIVNLWLDSPSPSPEKDDGPTEAA